jgi:hypothetical protein
MGLDNNLLLTGSTHLSDGDNGFIYRLRQIPWHLLLPLAAAFIGFVFLQCSVPIIDYELNADSMYIFMITKDIIFDDGRVADWFISVHLFIYPDILLAIPIILMHKLGLPIFVGCIATYGFLLTFLIAYAWQTITCETLTRSLVVGTVLIGILFFGDYLIYWLVSQQNQTPEMTTALKHTYAVGHVLGPALHSGAFLLAFALFFPLHSALTRSNVRAVMLGWLSINVVLVTLSDLIFIAWGIIPLSIVALSQVSRNTLGRWGVAIAVLWISGFFGYLISWLFSSEFAYLANASRPLGEAVLGLAKFAMLASSMTQPSITFFLATNVLLWCTGVYFFFKELTSSVSSIGRGLTIFAGAMSAASVLAPVASGFFTGEQVRYFIPYLIVGPLFCAFIIFLALHQLITSGRWSACLGGLAFTAFIGGCFALAFLPGATASQLYECLKTRGLSSGRADFWDAAPVVVASGWRVSIAHLAPGTLDIFPWLTKKQWLQQSPNPSDQSFLILGRDTAQRAIVQYGAPEVTFSCAGRDILVYRHPSWGR